MKKQKSIVKTLALTSVGLASQQAGAAIVTVAGTSSPLTVGTGTDLNGVLDGGFGLTSALASIGTVAFLSGSGVGFAYSAFRSSATAVGTTSNIGGTFLVSANGVAAAPFGVQSGSDNWVGGLFSIGGTFVYGWLELDIAINGIAGEVEVDVLSFTYDDAAIDGTPFDKPVGGFAIPEPSSTALLALGAAGVLAQRRRRNAA